MAATTTTTRVLRQLLAEIRKGASQPRIKDAAIPRYVLAESRKYATTDQQLCKAKEEMEFIARTYLCYLSSRRRANEINVEYTGRGERSIEDTAKLVGFKLPHDTS